MHAWGLRLRRVLRILAWAHPQMSPSAMTNDVGTLVAFISQLNTQPACAPVNASCPALRLATHDSGSGWLAMPFLCDSFIHYSTPDYPGAPTVHAGPHTAVRRIQLLGADQLWNPERSEVGVGQCDMQARRFGEPPRAVSTTRRLGGEFFAHSSLD